MNGAESSLTFWGTGSPMREFLYVDDLAAACIFLMKSFSAPGPINVGTGSEISIRDLAEKIANLAGYKGEIRWDSSKPDGTPRKCLDVSRLTELGFSARTSLTEGLQRTLDYYITHRDQLTAGVRPAV